MDKDGGGKRPTGMSRNGKERYEGGWDGEEKEGGRHREAWTGYGLAEESNKRDGKKSW